jgi:hypothetical protein
VAQERLDLIESVCRDDTTSDDNDEGEHVTKETEGQSTKMGDAADELLCQKCTVPTCGDCGTDERGLDACGTIVKILQSQLVTLDLALRIYEVQFQT